MAIFTTDRKIACVASSWHGDIVNTAVTSCIEELSRLGEQPDRCVDRFTVPGVLEIPLVSLRLMETRKYACIVGFAFVVDGGIYHPEYVSQSVLTSFTRFPVDFALKTGVYVPFISTVLSPHHFQEDEHHTRFFMDHMIVKGREAAKACVETVKVLDTIA